MEALSPSSKERFMALQDEGKGLAAEGFLLESLSKFKEAAKICETKKVLSRIKRLEEALINEVDEEDIDDMVAIENGLKVHKTIYNKLYDYQRKGVAWMYTLYKMGKGGILADDMGLGKTFQTIAFLSGMIDANLITHVLIIMPVSLLENWRVEFTKWCPGISVYSFHGRPKKVLLKELNSVQRRGGVMITSYGMVTKNAEDLGKMEGGTFVWDYVILDEGHTIRNPTKGTKAVHEIPSKYRIVITGTAIQNNLRELWALFDFAHHGTLLGSLKTFKMQYETPIVRGREKDATFGEAELGKQMSQNLVKIYQPYYLCRTKDEVFQMKGSVDELENGFSKLEITKRPEKSEFMVWIYLSDIQCELYQNFLKSDSVKNILMSTRSPLCQLNVLKKICDHPRLLPEKACAQLGLCGNISEEMLEDLENHSSIDGVSDEILIKESGKLAFAIKLLENLRNCGHRTLMFSQSLKILDMVQRILGAKGWKILRMDGKTKMEQRAQIIDIFQASQSYSLFLLTTKVGGVGINLTAADRVIIYDPSWNPATDAQAVDRAFRIGQTKDVLVYRLITCDTVEEKIYRRQIFKGSITRQATGSQSDPLRYFSRQELRELFTVESFRYSATQVQLEEMHSRDRKSNDQLDAHLKYLCSLNVFGMSDHTLMFSKEAASPNLADDEGQMNSDYIKKRVELAQMMVKSESTVTAQEIRESGTFVKPFTLPIPSSNKKGPQDEKVHKPDKEWIGMLEYSPPPQENLPIPKLFPPSPEDKITPPALSEIEQDTSEEHHYGSFSPNVSLDLDFAPKKNISKRKSCALPSNSVILTDDGSNGSEASNASVVILNSDDELVSSNSADEVSDEISKEITLTKTEEKPDHPNSVLESSLGDYMTPRGSPCERSKLLSPASRAIMGRASALQHTNVFMSTPKQEDKTKNNVLNLEDSHITVSSNKIPSSRNQNRISLADNLKRNSSLNSEIASLQKGFTHTHEVSDYIGDSLTFSESSSKKPFGNGEFYKKNSQLIQSISPNSMRKQHRLHEIRSNKTFHFVSQKHEKTTSPVKSLSKSLGDLGLSPKCITPVMSNKIFKSVSQKHEETVSPVRNISKSLGDLVQSPKRITPIQVHNDEPSKYCKSFEKAMNDSVEYPTKDAKNESYKSRSDIDSPVASFRKKTHIKTNSYASDADSPIIWHKKGHQNIITSDTEDSDSNATSPVNSYENKRHSKRVTDSLVVNYRDEEKHEGKNKLRPICSRVAEYREQQQNLIYSDIETEDSDSSATSPLVDCKNQSHSKNGLNAANNSVVDRKKEEPCKEVDKPWHRDNPAADGKELFSGFISDTEVDDRNEKNELSLESEIQDSDEDELHSDFEVIVPESSSGSEDSFLSKDDISYEASETDISTDI